MDAQPCVTLAPLERRHLDATRAWANDPLLNALMLRALPVCETDQDRWYEALIGNPARQVFAILWRANGCHIGNTGLYQIDWLHRRAELWILIGARDYQGRGAGSAALAALRRFAFDDLGLNRLSLRVAVENTPALSLYTRQGFAREGVLREESYIQGRYRDVLVMSQLRKDYERQKRSG